jgi:hypothetical protein
MLEITLTPALSRVTGRGGEAIYREGGQFQRGYEQTVPIRFEVAASAGGGANRFPLVDFGLQSYIDFTHGCACVGQVCCGGHRGGQFDLILVCQHWNILANARGRPTMCRAFLEIFVYAQTARR